ncbi:MAG: phospholipid transport system substrate-binding protein [Verrucomicrobia bacterium]|nr:MAG: phospholipid transport system substrate-binding protein [Verrucomicrobiota bacterium]
MLPYKPSHVLSALVVLCASPLASAATAETPDATLNRGLAEILSVVKGHPSNNPAELAKRLRPTLEKFFNFESLTRKALGAGWKDLTKEQQTQAVKLFSEIIIRSYTSKFDPNSQVEIQFAKAQDLGDGRKEVPAAAKYQGKVVAVSYRMETALEAWRVYDVIVEGVSLAANYRAQFDSIRQKGGSEALLKAMEDKLK